MEKIFNLTPRELEVLNLFKVGLTSKQIAKQFGRSKKTIDQHNMNLRAKLHDARNIREALYTAYKFKLIE
jgi:DNA-binding CsgD family transcriptional regulator